MLTQSSSPTRSMHCKCPVKFLSVLFCIIFVVIRPSGESEVQRLHGNSVLARFMPPTTPEGSGAFLFGGMLR